MRGWLGQSSALLLAVGTATLAFGGPAKAADPTPWHHPVAATVAQSRNVINPVANDFIRLIFVPATASVSSLGLKQARVFMAATSFFRPPPVAGVRKPFTLSAAARLTGGAYSATLDVAAMRCSLPDAPHSAIVASWPNVFTAITGDLAPHQCKPMPTNPTAENQVFCLAQSFRDRRDTTAVKPLAAAIDNGLAMMQVSDTTGQTGADVLGGTYGIGLGFSGLGFSVAGSLDTALNSAQSLQLSAVTEYLVKNTTLKAAGCHCIQVHTYNGRDTAPMDPDYIVERGTLAANGLCVRVSRLGLASPGSQASQERLSVAEAVSPQ